MSQESDHSPIENDSRNPERQRGGLTRAAIWLGGSALFGSLALVLWNRRALLSMREARVLPETPLSSDNDIY